MQSSVRILHILNMIWYICPSQNKIYILYIMYALSPIINDIKHAPNNLKYKADSILNIISLTFMMTMMGWSLKKKIEKIQTLQILLTK